MRRPSDVEFIGQVVRRVLRRDWAPSRAMDFKVSLRVGKGWERRVVVRGRGFGSVAVR